MRAELGDEYTNALRKRSTWIAYPVVPTSSPTGSKKPAPKSKQVKTQRVGLVATNSIRGGANRKVLERIVATAPIFEAWSDEPWINNGAAVRVSLVCFGRRQGTARWCLMASRYQPFMPTSLQVRN